MPILYKSPEGGAPSRTPQQSQCVHLGVGDRVGAQMSNVTRKIQQQGERGCFGDSAGSLLHWDPCPEAERGPRAYCSRAVVDMHVGLFEHSSGERPQGCGSRRSGCWKPRAG